MSSDNPREHSTDELLICIEDMQQRLRGLVNRLNSQGEQPAVFRPQTYRERGSTDSPHRFLLLQHIPVRGEGGGWSPGMLVRSPQGNTYAMQEEEFNRSFVPSGEPIPTYAPHDQGDGDQPPSRYILHARGVQMLTLKGIVDAVIYSREDAPEILRVAPEDLFDLLHEKQAQP